jgi:hypothetical protein
MNADSPLLFIIPLAVIVAGFSIGNRDGAIISIVDSAALFAIALWRAFKILGRK